MCAMGPACLQERLREGSENCLAKGEPRGGAGGHREASALGRLSRVLEVPLPWRTCIPSLKPLSRPSPDGSSDV